MCDPEDINKKMFCWNMISIETNSKLINLIIPNEKEMDILITALLQMIYKENIKTNLDKLKH